MTHGATYLGDGDGRTRSERRGAEEEDITERTEALIRGEEMQKGGYPTPCNDWVYPDEVRKHAERCSACRTLALTEAGDAK